MIARFRSDYGMLGVLLLLCLIFSWATLQDQQPEGRLAADRLLPLVHDRVPEGGSVILIAGVAGADSQFCHRAESLLQRSGYRVLAIVQGTPPQIRNRLQVLVETSELPAALLTTPELRHSVATMRSRLPGLQSLPVLTARPYRWPTFLLRENLINVVNQIVVIGVIAIGMTMVIITAGIDLSVGSLVALSAVVAAGLIARYGGSQAGTGVMVGASLAAVVLCGLIGGCNGFLITRFRIPPFIATLGWMLVASGLAYLLAEGRSIYDVPEAYTWLGRGTGVAGIPNAVILMGVLYVAAHVLMSSTRLGRYIYAVGANPEAARLSGVRVTRVLWFVYAVSGMMAGLGGIVLASQLKSGAPTYGLLYELYVIAAVVVGGASLSGGEGNVIGTLIGALIIGVIQNGMNLTGVESYTQKVVLGMVILAAVLLDRLRQGRGE